MELAPWVHHYAHGERMLKSKLKTKVKDKGFNKAIKAIQEAAGGPKVKVGILARDGGKVASGDSLNLAGIAAVNEYGTKSAGRGGTTVIPSRPFMRHTMDSNFRKYNALTRKLIIKMLKGEITVDKALDILGVKITADVKRTITLTVAPPNARSTIRAKGSMNPLIDTGRMRSSMNYEVEITKTAASILNTLIKAKL